MFAAEVTSVLVAFIAAAGGVLAAREARGAKAASRAAHEEVRTNHGKRAGEYLEHLGAVVGAVQVKQDLMDARLCHLTEDVAHNHHINDHFRRAVSRHLGLSEGD